MKRGLLLLSALMLCYAFVFSIKPAPQSDPFGEVSFLQVSFICAFVI